MRLALFQPDIPQNTGTLLRTAACFGVAVDVIGPTGFDMTDRALRRAGLDYLDHVEITRHLGFDDFQQWRASAPGRPRLILLSTQATQTCHDFEFNHSDILMLGRESAGVPDNVRASANSAVRIPILAGLRSLNVAIAGAIALSEALRQTGQIPAQPTLDTLE
jgi:tRNA (cytidine/uridine-2'-O-)-methyltransferase